MVRPIFSRREIQVLERLAEGWIVRDIAADLGLSIKTIESICTHIQNKKGLENMHQLIVYAVRYVYALAPMQRLGYG